jgi:hypothetical protein
MYFDKETPTINIHENNLITPKYKTTRFLFDTFPAKIIGKKIDSNLALWWDAATTSSSPFLKYLYYYQILEFTAYYYLQADEEQRLNNIIGSPEIIHNKERAITEILDVLTKRQTTDEQKLNLIIKKYVDPATLWKEIEPLLPYFSEEIAFEGGIVISKLLSSDCNSESFQSQWQTLLPAINIIRNSIAHARERRSSATITPNRKNRAIIRPWVAIISCIAAQVIAHQ